MSENRNAPAAPAGAERPLWARATTHFAGPSFDVRTKRDYADAMREFVTLSPGEQAYHKAHLLFRGVQALEGIHVLLSRLDRRLSGMDLDELRHLGPMRAALEDLADGQEELLEAQTGSERPLLNDDEPPGGPLITEDERPLDPEDAERPFVAASEDKVEVLEMPVARRRGGKTPPEAA